MSGEVLRCAISSSISSRILREQFHCAVGNILADIYVGIAYTTDIALIYMNAYVEHIKIKDLSTISVRSVIVIICFAHFFSCLLSFSSYFLYFLPIFFYASLQLLIVRYV